MRVSVLVVLLAALVCVLAVLLFGAGTIDNNPSYADNKDLVLSQDDHIGEQAEIDGQIVDTSPVRIEIEYGPETRKLIVGHVDELVETGENLRVLSTVTSGRTIRAETTVVR